MIRNTWLALLMLTALSGEASAECAWVLRKETEGTRAQNWTLWNAHETKSECNQRALRSASFSASRPAPEGVNVTKKLEGDTITTLDSDGKQVRYERFWCLPAGTDPRPRFKD